MKSTSRQGAPSGTKVSPEGHSAMIRQCVMTDDEHHYKRDMMLLR